MEEEIILDMFHEHPLGRIPESESVGWCYGCRRYFLAGDAVYGCSRRCGFMMMLHKECMEMPRGIRHPLHPSHPLTLHDFKYSFRKGKCGVCEEFVFGMGYRCSVDCELLIHIGCSGGLINDEKQPLMEHPSHPQHELRFSKTTRWSSFPCNACGATEKGNSYVCTICDYWIHESCALLPASASFAHHPDHSLSLAFYPPYQYIKYEFECAICSGTLALTRWLYHCHLCRYIVHINCATNTSSNPFNENEVDDEKGITKGPIGDIYEEIIRPFVKRERGQIFIPHDHDNHKYNFSNHPHHQLSFTRFSASSSSRDHNEEEEEDDDDDVPRWGLTCDGCTLPIQENKQTYDDGYMSCDECTYFLHLSCFNLPIHLHSPPIHNLKDHSLMLRNAAKLLLTDWPECSICFGYTNGLIYSCSTQDCYFKMDIKCASLPNTIKHAAHPQHNNLKLVTYSPQINFCGFCYDALSRRVALYRCDVDSCSRFSVCVRCVLLPSRNRHRLEKHQLLLTYDAYVNRPGDFYCSSCEEQMNPKMRMYHCRDCDQSFHPECIPAASGPYRNINFGMQQYVIPSIHDPHHPLRFQIITNKKRCNRCHGAAYDEPGFQCVSCNFVMCLCPCGIRHMDDASKVPREPLLLN